MPLLDDPSRAAVVHQVIPTCLRPVAPFIEEAQSIFRKEMNRHSSRIAALCVNHAFELVDKFDLVLDEQGHRFVTDLAAVRDLAITLHPVDGVLDPRQAPGGVRRSLVKINPEDVLKAEAFAVMAVAEEQENEGLKVAAARNFHTATVYFRVLESLVPSLTSEIHEKMQYCSLRCRQCSHLIENFVHEHFEGKKFAEQYEIFEKKKLGKGSYGSVFLCRHRRTGDEYACKVISLNRINSHYLRKLHLEIAIMKEVTHPQIVQLREVFFGSRTVYLVMELCRGGELFEYLAQHGSKGLSEAQSARHIRDMLSAITYIHSINIMHRDLKLENFLFDSKSANASLKLIDFGLSKHFESHENMHQIVGSAYYTAPEVLGGHYDQRCDTWSIGVIAYMLLSGSPPFYGESSEEIHDMIKTKEADFNPRRFGNCSSVAIDFLQRLLRKRPDDRMTLEEAMHHPFIGNLSRVEDPTSPRIMEVVDSLERFVRSSNAKQLVMKIVAFSLSPADINSLREAFNFIDSNRNGTISMSELHESIRSFKGITAEAVDRHFEQVGLYVDKDECLNYNEFIAAAMCKRISIDEDRLMQAFEAIDDSNSGYISSSQIRSKLGYEVDESVIKEMFAEIDVNNDGKIDYMEFLKYWRAMMIKINVTPLQKFKSSAKKISNAVKVVRMMALSSKAKSIVAMTKQLSGSKDMSAVSCVSRMDEDGDEVVFPGMISKAPSAEIFTPSAPSYMSMDPTSSAALLHNPEVEDMDLVLDEEKQ